MDHRSLLAGGLFVSAAAFFVFLNTLPAEFVYDDSRAIVRNADLKAETSWWNLVLNDYWGTPMSHMGSHKSYRPLTVATFRANYALGALDPRGYHLVNVLLHTLATALVYLFVSISFSVDWQLATFCGALFAVHPIHSEAVAGVVGRADILTTIFVISGLLLFKLHVASRTASGRPASEWRLWFTVLMAGCALFSKEQGIALLPICFAYDLTRGGFGQLALKANNKPFYHTSAILAFSLSCLLFFRLWMMNFAAPFFSPSDNPAAFDSSVVTRTLTFLYLPIFNLRLLTIPDQLSFDWSMDSIPLVRSIADSRAIISLIFYCTFAIVSRILLNQLLARGRSTEATDRPISARRSPSPKLDINANIRRRHPLDKDNRCVDYHCASPKVCSEQKSAFSFDDTDVEAHCNSLDTFQEITLAFSLLVLPFIPASNLVAYVGFVVAERVLYLPSVGFCILLTLAVRSCRNRWRRDRRAEKLLYFACCGVLFFLAARTWRRNCDWQSEESLYSSGIAINPAKAYSNLGNVLARKQKTAEAENAYRKALSFRSNMADTHYNLGSLLQEQKRHAEAVDSYKLAISYRNNLAAAHLNLGLCQWTLGHLKEAEEIFIACAKLNGANLKDPKAHRNAQTSCEYNRGRLLAEQGRFSNAIEAYNSAIGRLSVDDHYPSTASLYNMLGEAYAKLGRLEQAETFYQKALAEKHNHVPAHLTMGHLRLKQQQNEEALKWFETAVQLSPDDVLVHQHLGQFYQQTHEPERALDSFKTAHKLDGTNFDILFALANAYRQLSKNEEAERCYQSLVELRPDASALASYGAILHLNKKYAEAETAYLKALTIKPDDKMTTENLQKLRRLMRK